MFQFPGFASRQCGMTGHDSRRVAPFGNLRIYACVPLPEAYRSLPRPSSPVCAKASTMRPSILDQHPPPCDGMILRWLLRTSVLQECQLPKRQMPTTFSNIKTFPNVKEQACLQGRQERVPLAELPFQVENMGLEPTTSGLQSRRSPN